MAKKRKAKHPSPAQSQDPAERLADLEQHPSVFRLASEASMAGVYVIQDGRVRYANPALSRIVGYEPEELIGLSIPGDIVHEDDREKVAEFIRRRIEGEVESMQYTLRAVRKDGSVVHVEVLGRAVELDGRSAVVGTLLDITDRERASEALIESEALFRGLAENSPNMIFINHRGRVVYASQACLETLGYSPRELMDTDFDFMQLIAPESAALVQRNFLAHAQGKEIPAAEYQLMTKDGKKLDAIIATRLISYKGDVAILGIVTDVSERKRTERELQRLFEVEREHRQLAEAVARVGLSITAQLDLHDLLDLICLEATRLFGAGSAFVWYIQGQELVGFAGHGGEREAFIGQRVTLDDPHSLATRVVREARPIYVNRARGSPIVNQKLVELFGVESILGVPLVRGSRAVGALMVLEQTNPDRFDEHDLQTALALGSQLAIAIESAQLIEADQRNLERLRSLHQVSLQMASSLELASVFDTILVSLLDLVGASNAHIYPYNQETGEFGEGAALHASGDRRPAVPAPRQDGITATVARSGEALIIEEVASHPLYSTPEAQSWQLEAIAGFPLKVGERVVGVLTVAYLHPHRFLDDELQLLELLANQAAIAISNADLYEQAQGEIAERMQAQEALVLAVEQLEIALERAEELAKAEEAMRDSTAALSGTLNVDEVLDRILANVVRVAPADTADIMLMLEGEGGKKLVAGVRGRGYTQVGWQEWIESLQLPLQNIPNFAIMARTGEPIAIPDTSQSEVWVEVPETAWIRSYAGAPIRIKDRTLGFLNLCSETPGFYSQVHADRLQAFADHAAIAIENARLFDRAERRLQEQQELIKAGAVIASTLDIDTILSHIAEQMGKAVDATSAYICSYDEHTLQSTVLAEYFGPRARDHRSDLGVTYDLPVHFPGTIRPMRKRLPEVMHVDDPALPEAERKHMREFGVKSTLTIPLEVGGRVIAYAELWESESRKEFTPEEIRLCQAISQQAAIAIENGRLYARAQSEIEERKLAERALRQVTEFNESIIASMSEGIVLQDAQGNIEFANPAAEQLMGYEPGELLGRHWTQIIPDDQVGIVIAADQRRVAGKFDRYEVEVMHKSGRRIPLLVSGSPRLQEGEFVGTLAVFTDISALKEIQSAEQELQTAKDEFIRSASHSLRTPLHTLQGFLELLRAGKVEDPAVRDEFLQRAADDADRLSSLIMGLLDIADLEAGGDELEKEQVDLVDVIQQAQDSVGNLARRRGVELQLDVRRRPMLMRVHPSRIRQALVNLMENAVRVSQAGQAVAVEADVPQDGSVVIRVIDQGPGIPKAEIPKLFLKRREGEPPRSWLGDATGLGLYLTRIIIEAHGGEIQVESGAGKGTVITCSLPLK